MQETNADGSPNIDVTKESTDATVAWILQPTQRNAEICRYFHDILEADESIAVIAAGWAASGAGWQKGSELEWEPSVEAAAATAYWPYHTDKALLLEEADAWERLRFLTAVRDILPEPTERCIRTLE